MFINALMIRDILLSVWMNLPSSLWQRRGFPYRHHRGILPRQIVSIGDVAYVIFLLPVSH